MEQGMDPWEFLTPTDVLSKLPGNFYEQLESTKWLERKECLEILLKEITSNPRLDPSSNYGEIVSVIKKILSKDSNINVVAVAAKILTGLALGLRKKFTQFVPMFVPVILEKFKEKKPLVATPCAEAIDAMAKTTTLEAISEDLLAALDHKTPSVKVQTQLFLSRFFAASTTATLTKKILKLFCASLVKNLTVSEVDVRDASAAALGAAMKVVGENNIAPFLAEIKEDHLKMEKIKEHCDKTVLIRPLVTSVVTNAAGPSGSAGSSDEVQAVVEPEVDPWEYLTPTDVLATLPKNFYEQLESPKWSERKECLEILLKQINDNPRLDPASNYGELMSVIKKILSKDSNINVVAVAAKILTGLALGLRKKFAQFVPMFVPVIFEKFKEKKPLVATPCAEAIDAVAKATTLEAIADDVIAALDNKTPSVKVQSALFLSRSFAALTPTILNKKLLKLYCPSLVKNLTVSDPDVRDAGAAALGAAMKVVGISNILPYLIEIKEDRLKMEKIKEFCEKTVLIQPQYEPPTIVAPSVPVPSNPKAPVAVKTKIPDDETKKVKEPNKTAPSRPLVASSVANSAGSSASATSNDEVHAVVEPEIDRWDYLTPTDVLATLPNNFYEQLESPKWSERKECLEILLKQINDNPRLDPASNYGELMSVIKKILSKDSNINVVAVAAKILTGLALGLRKKFTQFVPMFVPVILEKFKEKKPLVAAPCAEAIDAVAKTTTLETISEDLLAALDHKTPSVKVQTQLFLSRFFAASTTATLTKKILKLFCASLVKNLTVSEVDVRDASAAALGAAMKVVGENNIAPFLAEIKEDHLKMEKIKEYCDKTILIRPLVAKAVATAGPGASAGSSDEVQAVVEPEVDPWEYLTPTDVLATLPKNFYEQLESPKWSERKECLEILLKQINDNPRLDPASNYGELMSVIKKILSKDNNINVVAVAAKILTGLALGLRKKFAQFVPMFVPVIFEKFKEKKPLVATPCAEAIDAVAKATTLEAIADDVIAALDNKTPSVKVQSALFLSRSFAASTPNILNKKLLKIYCASLVKNLTVSDPEVRDASASALGAAMKVVSINNILPFLIEIKEDRLKMDKIKEYCDKTVLTRPQCEPAAAVAPSAPVPSNAKAPVAVKAKIPDDKTKKAKENGEKPVAVSRPPSNVMTESKPGETGVRPKKVETYDGGALIDTKQKTQRFQDEKSLKLLRWTFNAPTDEHVEQLKIQMATVCKPALHVQLYHSDFKQYLKALETLTQCIDTCPDATINSLDLLLKWSTLRFFETNPSVLLKCLEYIQSAFALCIDRGNVELHDIEVNSFLPYLLLKSGEAKEPVRLGVRQILEKMCKLYPTSKLFPLIIEGCKTKNSRQKAECLEQLGSLIELYGIVVCGQPPSTSLKAIAQNIGDRDNSVRNAALNAIVAAYMHVGDRVYKLVGAINEKDFRMLEERIKRTAKNRLVIKPVASSLESEEKKVSSAGSQASARGKSPAAARQPLAYVENGQESSAEAKKSKQPAPGMFQLDLEKIGANQDISEDAYRMPKLKEDFEIDDILKNPMNVPRAIKLRPASPAKRVSQNMDAVTMLDTAISQVTSSSMGTSIQALVQLDEIIKDQSKSHFLAGKIDQLLMAVYFQLRMAYNSHMNDNTILQNDVVRLYRHLCVVLLSLCSAGNLVKEASEGSLKDLVCQLLTVLVDERLNFTNEGAELVRSINILIVNLVTNTDHTACIVALMRLLRDTLHSQTSSAKFQELVMKCIWKLSKSLQTFADKLQIDRILVEAHQFFVDFPVATWKTRPSDTPSRTVKTILNTLCQIYSDKILDFVGSIEQPETSEAVQYLKKCLRDICAKPSTAVQQNGHGQSLPSSVDAPMPPHVNEKGEGASNQTNESMPSDEQSSMNANQPVGRVFNKYLRAELSEIFKKVGSKEKTKEGLSELYDFLQAHPETDIDAFYKKASPFFQNYIQKNLKRIAEEREKLKDSQTSNGVTVSGSESVNFMEKLQILRANCGLEPAGLNTPKLKGKDDAAEFTLPQLRTGSGDFKDESKKVLDQPSTESELTSDDIDNLKRRLEKIKRGAL